MSKPPEQPTAASLPPVLFANQHFVILDKPAGMPVHAGPRGQRSIEDLFPLLSRRAKGPWLAHRLDADTAGCLVIALRHAALLQAQRAFADGSVQKTYWAVVRGRPESDHGRIENRLAKHSDRGGWRMRIDASGDLAITEWRLRGACADLSWLELFPKTGRTHQIRVHCAALGTPILGDALYGSKGPGLHLLARAIQLPLEPPIGAQAEPPAAMQAAFARCGFSRGS